MSATLLNALLSTSRAIIVCDCGDGENPIRFVNAAFTAVTGYTAEEAIGKDCRFLQGADTDVSTCREIRDALAARLPIRRAILNYRKDGRAFWNDLALDPLRNGRGKVTGYVGVMSDVSREQAAPTERGEAQLQMASIVRNLPGYIFRHIHRKNGDDSLTYLSRAMPDVPGLSDETIPDTSEFLKHIHPEDMEALARGVMQSAEDLSPYRQDFRVVVPDGTSRWYRASSMPRTLENGDIVWEGLAIDITEQKAIEARLAYLAYHDPLTGLPNRLLFKEAIGRALDSPAGGSQVAVFHIDLDDFQEINDTLGQPAGDQVLRMIGHRLTEVARAADGTAARLGGDEFALMLPRLGDFTILEIMDRIRGELAGPMEIAGSDIVIESSSGAVSVEGPERDGIMSAADPAAELMKQADIALHAAKQSGRGSQTLYAPELDHRVRHRMKIRQSLSRAIAEEQFELHYHPLVDLSSGAIIGAEALLRWAHPELGMLRPDLFIPLAEESGQIVPLGAWVLREAMRQSVHWIERKLPPLQISVNVSGVQIQRPGFLATVDQALALTGANPDNFKFELTEGVLVEATPDLFRALDEIKARGFALVMDDFGTGHSSLKYLRDFPVDMIKIDQTFVRRLVVDSSDASIVRAIISLARSLTMEVVAEGIETAMQRDFLRAEGCRIGQGHFFGLPVAAEDFGWMLEQRVRLPMGLR